MAKWIRFDLYGNSASGKTKVWNVVATEGCKIIGWVAWYAPWRKYAFSAVDNNCVFEQDCLRDIAAFIETATREHKAA